MVRAGSIFGKKAHKQCRDHFVNVYTVLRPEFLVYTVDAHAAMAFQSRSSPAIDGRGHGVVMSPPQTERSDKNVLQSWTGLFDMKVIEEHMHARSADLSV